MKNAFVSLLLAVAVSSMFATVLRAAHTCDALGDPGWSTVPSEEIVGVRDALPYRDGENWFVERTTTVLPLCNYINASGNYSLRSYSLGPEDTTERVTICKGVAKVAPYSGSCPPQ